MEHEGPLLYQKQSWSEACGRPTQAYNLAPLKTDIPSTLGLT